MRIITLLFYTTKIQLHMRFKYLHFCQVFIKFTRMTTVFKLRKLITFDFKSCFRIRRFRKQRWIKSLIEGIPNTNFLKGIKIVQKSWNPNHQPKSWTRNQSWKPNLNEFYFYISNMDSAKKKGRWSYIVHCFTCFFHDLIPPSVAFCIELKDYSTCLHWIFPYVSIQ